ncbi:MAG: hypothetical protein ACPGU1_22115 [Myxococcota bacterium]
MLGLLCALPSPSAHATSPIDALDAASACHRRGKAACTLEHADAALSALGDTAKPSLLREALRLRAEALAQLDRAEEAEAACITLIQADTSWRPSPDADPRVLRCFSAASGARSAPRAEQAPSTTDALPPPPPTEDVPPVTPGPEPTATDAPPLAPEDIVPWHARTNWRFSLGGGLAVPYPYSPTLFAPGPAAVLDLGYRLWGDLDLWAQVTMSLLNFDDTVPIEPGFGRSLTVVSGVIGLAYVLPILSWLDMHTAAGIGTGAFGVTDLEQRAGLALDLSLGVRVNVDRHLAVRLDIIPTTVIPLNGEAIGGHISAVARCEFRF